MDIEDAVPRDVEEGRREDAAVRGGDADVGSDGGEACEEVLTPHPSGLFQFEAEFASPRRDRGNSQGQAPARWPVWLGHDQHHVVAACQRIEDRQREVW